MNYLGVDYDKKYSSVTMEEESGGVIRQVRTAKTREPLESPFEGLEGPSVGVMEAGRNWMVMHDVSSLRSSSNGTFTGVACQWAGKVLTEIK